MDIDQTIVRILMRFRPARVVSVYLLFQAVSVAGWWLLLVFAPDVRPLFFPEALVGDALMSFWLADLGLLVGGSLLAAWLVWTRNPAASAAIWFLAGALYYPALYCLAVSLRLGGGALGVASMFTAAGLTLAMATIVGPGDNRCSGFRECSSQPAWTAVKTLLQIVVFWGTFLFVLPYSIIAMQDEIGLTRISAAGLFWSGLVGMVCFSVLGLWSAATTIRVGGGTPLPTDCSPVLIVQGPYRFVRNPMALAGIGQGVMVGVMCGSWPVVIYALCGALAWHFGARPVEEADLQERFGEPYERYRAAVRCWVPLRRSNP